MKFTSWQRQSKTAQYEKRSKVISAIPSPLMAWFYIHELDTFESEGDLVLVVKDNYLVDLSSGEAFLDDSEIFYDHFFEFFDQEDHHLSSNEDRYFCGLRDRQDPPDSALQAKWKEWAAANLKSLKSLTKPILALPPSPGKYRIASGYGLWPLNA